MTLHVLGHPPANKILTDLREKNTPVARFRELGKQLTYFLLIEATRGLKTKLKNIKTPLADFDDKDLDQSIIVVLILRAGLLMLQPVIDTLQDVARGYIGMECDETTALARTYYCKLRTLKSKFAVVIDPTLATGHSVELALEAVIQQNPDNVVMISMIVSSEGIRHLQNLFPDIPIYTAAVDERRDEHKLIFPGLGDFGDRTDDTN
jgi:uracil phosphoribosyltransferase